ncbi:MAG TPA: transcription antitermination factor NusB [Rubrobacteraceae bacterium]|nr:transcription antitermination factor NusB [Rubrobacteraceae bacterium]
MSRRTARKQAFLTLYQADLNEQPVSEVLARWRSYRGHLDEHAVSLADGVERERAGLDAVLSEVSEGWPIHRMSVVDRAILRLALYEMLYVEDVPAEVAISEAMEIAKGFSSEESPAFVGGVLRGAAARNPDKDRVGHG